MFYGGLVMNEELGITGNIKVIEWVKVELLGAVTSLYKALLKGAKSSQDMIRECLADIIILAYLLSRRLGMDFSSVDREIENKLKIGISEEDEIERVDGDLSKLLNYIKDKR
jgi:hypothetical protein